MSSFHAFRSVIAPAAVGVATLLGTACSSSGLVDVGAPPGSSDPAAVNSYDGALQRYGGALLDMANLYGTRSGFVQSVALMTDELTITDLPTKQQSILDMRTAVSDAAESSSLYGGLQILRVQAGQGASALQQYSQTPPALIARMYAMEGYAEVMLAEMFCNGIPLTTIPLGGGAVNYSPARTTTDVLTSAVAHFDSALALAGDSASYVTLATVGKGRALLGLGDYTGAAAAVQHVVTTDSYAVEYSTGATFTPNSLSSVLANNANFGSLWQVVDTEGHNGIAWISANDPRVPLTVQSGEYVPTKYATPSTSIPLATGIEARLIEAEADLHADGTQWLPILDTLRASVGLPALTDPGTAAARVDLLFQERAFWLYLTGHRLGDMRRLIRQYGRAGTQLFPVGAYRYSTWSPIYGGSVVVPVPSTEHQSNGKYTGCIDLNA